MAEKDYYSFEEVLNNLKLEEDELKRLVSAGEIRAFRDKDTMRFKAEDVDRLRTPGGDELVLEDDLELDLDEPVPAAPSRPAAPAATASEIEELDLGGDELELEDASEVSVIEEIDLGGDGEAASEPVVVETKVRTRGAGEAPAGARRAARATTAATTDAPAEEASEGVGMLALLVVGVVVMIVANFVVLDAHAGHPSNGLSRAIASFFS